MFNENELRDFLYLSTKIEKVVSELKNRAQNKDLRETVYKYREGHRFPHINMFDGGPYAVLSRSIASPNKEQLLFLQYAKKLNLIPIILEYDGKFVTINKEKFYLAKILFEDGSSVCIADTNQSQGKKISDIKTFWGENLVDFHHNIFKKFDDDSMIYDFTDWFNSTRFLGPDYYFFFLTLFLQNAILFENYLIDDSSENAFITSKVIPSIKDIENSFGVRPLIVPLVPPEEELDKKWFSYNEEIKKIMLYNLETIKC